MGLDDYTTGQRNSPIGSSNNSGKGDKKQFDSFTKEQFEEVLADTPHDWSESNYMWADEIIYETATHSGKFKMRVYSSIDKTTGRARKKGSDAIRLVVIETESERPVLKEKRTNRIKTWPKNLKRKINNISDRKDELEFCEECGSVMVIRQASDSGDKFYGCTSYPDCKNTKSLQ